LKKNNFNLVIYFGPKPDRTGNAHPYLKGTWKLNIDTQVTGSISCHPTSFCHVTLSPPPLSLSPPSKQQLCIHFLLEEKKGH
jgi:hypothetical protein